MRLRLDVPAACLAALICFAAGPALAQEPPSPPATDPQLSTASTFDPEAACPAAKDTPPSEAGKQLHALSLIGEPKFKPGFDHFDWVNPNAPKGGTLRGFAEGSFDSLNAFSVKGDPAAGLGLIYDSLMTGSPDEPSTEYCLICEWVSYPADYSSVTFGLNPKARFNDGSPITPEDVIFSLEALKKAHPRMAFYYKNVVKAEKTGPNEVTFTFDTKNNRELPQIVGQLTVLPKKWWDAKGADGEPRDITKSSLEVPLGSGAYRIKSFDPGRTITYERVKDYWAKDLPVQKGQYNFDEMNFTYFLDRTPGFEQFKSGKIDYWSESVANRWATAYNFPAIEKGWVKKEAIPVKRVAPMQSFVFNQRRKQFDDPRVRKAFALAFNFEEANKKLFYNSYVRVGSYFDNSELAAKGLPRGCELSILNEVKDEVPPQVFTTEWKNPVNNSPDDFRKHMREASQLLKEAGWKLDGRQLKNAQGETLNAEFLLVQPEFERIVLPYIQDLQKLGINASVRIVDSAQYKRREDTHDYDIIIDSFPQSESPGNEQRDFWGSAAADRDGTKNTAGIKNPAIDKLIDKVVFAKNRADLIAATRALDRVLQWNYYVVPQWHYPYERIAYWDVFGRPAKTPSQTSALTQTWWFDADKQKALAAQRGQ